MDIKDFNLLYSIDFPNLRTVTGEGSSNAAVVLIGEAPGGEEEAQGRPFVGKAGKNLSEFLDVIGLLREDIYITNAVKFRPTKLSDSGGTVNRAPTEDEVREFLPYLLWEIQILDPKLVVTLGNTPLKALLGNSATVGRLHGAVTELPDGRALFPLFHPASIIYNPELKEVYAADLIKLKAYLTEKELI